MIGPREISSSTTSIVSCRIIINVTGTVTIAVISVGPEVEGFGAVPEEESMSWGCLRVSPATFCLDLSNRRSYSPRRSSFIHLGQWHISHRGHHCSCFLLSGFQWSLLFSFGHDNINPNSRLIDSWFLCHCTLRNGTCPPPQPQCFLRQDLAR